MVFNTSGQVIIPEEINTIDANNLDVVFSFATAGRVCASIGGITTTASYADSFTIENTNLTTQVNCDVDTGTETVATVSTSDFSSAFFDYVLSDGTNYRAGTIKAVWDGTSINSSEDSTADIGTTSGLTLSTDISAGNARLRATATSDNWKVKTYVRTLTFSDCP